MSTEEQLKDETITLYNEATQSLKLMRSDRRSVCKFQAVALDSHVVVSRDGYFSVVTPMGSTLNFTIGTATGWMLEMINTALKASLVEIREQAQKEMLIMAKIASGGPLSE